VRGLGLLAAGLVLAACGPKASICGPSTAKVARAVDGDTLELEDGTRIRLLLVDTPETTLGHNDCYGAQAAAFTTDFVVGKTVTLAYDEASCTDRYGRTLAYVSVDGMELNLALIKGGYACELYVKPGGMAREMEFVDAESVAKTARIGLWGACNPVTCE
jgi:micrococcal nuclease